MLNELNNIIINSFLLPVLIPFLLITVLKFIPRDKRYILVWNIFRKWAIVLNIRMGKQAFETVRDSFIVCIYDIADAIRDALRVSDKPLPTPPNCIKEGKCEV